MSWKIVSVIAVVVAFIGIVLFSLYISSENVSTPPAYRFVWKLKIVDNNTSTLVLQVTDIYMCASGVGKISNVSIPLYSVVEFNTSTTYPFNASVIKYIDADENYNISTGDKIVINKTLYKISYPRKGYPEISSFAVITGYPWKEYEEDPFTIGSTRAIAYVPPPYIKVTPKIISDLEKQGDIVEGKNGNYYVWPIITWYPSA